MKGKAQLKELTDIAAGISFPGYDTVRQRFESRLKELIADNFRVAVRDIDYDDDSKHYYWTVDESVGHFGRRGELPSNASAVHVSCRCTIHVDPSKPLLEEFARVERAYEVFRTKRDKIMRMVLTAGGEI